MEYFRQFKDFDRQMKLFQKCCLRTRALRDRSDPFEKYETREFRTSFRFSKESVLDLCKMLEGTLTVDRRGGGLPVHMQVLAALRFYATGTLFLTGQAVGITESHACRLVRKVSQALCDVKSSFLYFPHRQDHEDIAQQFAELSGDNFPGIIGAIDCMHLRIQCPRKEDAQRFMNRKEHFSVNCQFICDPALRIINIVARWAGSTHDSCIFRNSRVKAVLDTGVYAGHLVGDSGYACTRYLLTPVLHEMTDAQRRYNQAHGRARSVVDRAIGDMKRRFPSLQYTLRTKLTTTHRIVVAIAILHNYAILRREESFEEEPEEYSIDVEPDEEDSVMGLSWREEIIRNHFS